MHSNTSKSFKIIYFFSINWIKSQRHTIQNRQNFAFCIENHLEFHPNENKTRKTKEYTRKLHVNASEEGKTIRRLRHTRLGNGHHATLARKWKTRRKSPLDTLPGHWHDGVMRTRSSHHRTTAKKRGKSINPVGKIGENQWKTQRTERAWDKNGRVYEERRTHTHAYGFVVIHYDRI